MPAYTPRPDLLTERVILITGAGDGLGRAAALTFARHGATVVLLGRTTSKLERVYDEIEAQGGPTPAITPLNLATAGASQYEELVQGIEKEFGRLDGLLHSATELGELTPLDMYDFEVWQKTMQVNLNAPYILTRWVMPLLAQSGDGSVVFTSADVGRKGEAYWGAYAVSQFALEGLSQVWADELEGGGRVRLNTLDPGPARTSLRARAFPAEVRTSVPAPTELMTAYLYLMGPDSRGVTGQALRATDWTHP